MNKPTHNYTINPGTTWSRSVTYQINGAPVDITDYESYILLKRKNSELASTVKELNAANGNTSINGPAGQILTSMNAIETSELSGQYHFFHYIKSPAGVVTLLLTGRMTA